MQRHFIGFLLVIIFFLSMVTLSIAEEVDRLAKLTEGAKKEGKVVWYSSFSFRSRPSSQRGQTFGGLPSIKRRPRTHCQFFPYP